MKNRSLKVDDFLWEEVDKCANLIGQSKSSLVRTAIIEKINRIHGDQEARYEITKQGEEAIKKTINKF